MKDSHGVAAYFDALYASLAQSPTHARIGREALGSGFVGQLGFAGEEELFRLAELAGMGPGRAVLDLCCGMGGTSVWYAQRTGSHVTGLDCSPVGLSLARKHTRASGVAIELVLADLWVSGEASNVSLSQAEHLDFAIGEFREMKMQPSLERALRHRGLLKA